MPHEHDGVSLAPSHVRLEQRVGRRPCRLRRGPLVGAGPCRLAAGAADPGGRQATCSTSAPRRAARRCSSPPPVTASPRSTASESRLARLRENLERTHLEAELVDADALKWTPSGQFDAILLDAPCSATGTFRRHPEVLYRARPEVIADSAELQAQLLDRAAQWLKPGGTLVYSVCSLEPRGRRAGRRRFLAAQPDFRIEPPSRRAARLRAVRTGRAGSASFPACSKPKAGSTASSWRGLSGAVNPV